MGRKRASGPGGLVIAFALVVAALSGVPKGVWVVVGVVVAAYFALKLMASNKSKPETTPGTLVAEAPAKQVSLSPAPVTHTRTTPLVEPVPVAIPSVDSGNFRIPEPKTTPQDRPRWVPPGESVAFVGFQLPGGMLYVGSGLRALNGAPELALLNPRLAVAGRSAGGSAELTGYWPTYANISAEARRDYLQWLAEGRSNPQVDIGYVFLFFYGLERRALIEAPSDSAAAADIPAIIAEVRRLLTLHGTSGSFRRYATSFLEYLEAAAKADGPLDLADPPKVEHGYELPLAFRLGLGQMALKGIPVPDAWAHAWALSDPNITRRTPVTRCAEVFESLFKARYRETYGPGMVLSVNRTKLRSIYRPASGGMAGRDFTTTFGDIPDVSATTVPLKRLQSLVDDCSAALDSYSRFVGRNPGQENSLEALLQLPPSLWPAPVRSELDDLKARIGDGLVVMSFGELSGRMKSAGTLTRAKVLGLAQAFESLHIGIEPDLLVGAKTPKAEDTVVLFATQPEDGAVRSNAVYQAAAVTVGLSYAVAVADGEVSPKELLHLTRQVEGWTHLSMAHRKRLKAHLRLQVAQPPNLATFRKKLEPLPAEGRRTIARFLAHLAQVDGDVAPEEVKFLERTYKALGVDAQLLYGDLHIAAMPGTPAQPGPTPTPARGESKPTKAFTLDPARIAALQKETADVSSLLAGVFQDDEQPEPEPMEPESADRTQLLGLDAEHSAFLRMLLTRPSWSRDDVANVAADMDLMLEGALEIINEAALDARDEPLVEGEDPLEINQKLMEQIPA
jgi:uncharacterized tellurite resistance protein B-like protein